MSAVTQTTFRAGAILAESIEIKKLTSDTLTTKNAAVTETLIAGNIFADNISGNLSIESLECKTANIEGNLTTGNIFADNISGNLSIESLECKTANIDGNLTAANISVSGLLLVDTDINAIGTITGGSIIDQSLSFGEIYMTNNTTATIPSDIDTWTKVDGTTTLNPLSIYFDTGSETNRLRYTGFIPTVFKVSVALSATANHNRSIMQFRIYVSGNPITSSEQFVDIHDENAYMPMSLTSLVLLNPDDFIEIWCKYTTGSTSNITVKDLVVNSVRVR
jgi:hypothetical protein